jgi:hypothetical protein
MACFGWKKNREFYSPETSWTVLTPNCSRKSDDRNFTADFYDSKIGFIAGGDYELRNQNFSNKALTTWRKNMESLQKIKVLGMPLVCNMFLKVTVKVISRFFRIVLFL